ncbi:MAG: mechanosensitive ion channel family protein [Candidatus Nanopelagicales bacterium]
MTASVNPLASLASKSAWTTMTHWLDGTPVFIFFVMLGTYVLNMVVSRTIKRAVQRAARAARHTRHGSEKRNARTAELTEMLMGERGEQRAEAIGQLLRSTSSVIIWSVGLLIVLSRLGIDLGPLLASAGVLGVALGFGAQALVKDYLAGIFIIIEDQYGVGDIVDVGPVVGTVEEITLRITRLRDLTGVVWYVRNGEIVRVANRSQGWTLAVMDIPVAYDENLERVRRIVDEVAMGMDDDPGFDDMLLGRPEFAGVESVSGDAVFIRVIAKAAPEQQVPVTRELRERIKNAFDKEGIRVPVLARPFSGPTPPGNPGPR